MSDRPVRVASYNGRGFRDDRTAAARIVRTIDPDVLCLQEAPRWLRAASRIRRFAAECGMRWVGGHRGSGGTTMLVSGRVVLDRSWHQRLPVAVLQPPRGYAIARVIPPSGTPLLVASVHLSLHAGERHAHSLRILRALGDPESGDPEPVRTVVAGDLNEFESGLAWRLLASRLPLVSPRVPTFPARRPRAMIDVVFATPDLRVVPTDPVPLDEDDIVAASDHRPVWVDLLA